ncbi:MAG: AraC family transcriptional regulator [Thermomicrobiales bacterium]|nr:AraC family transcriptional regulator [Thermomicrobiales bacterium]
MISDAAVYRLGKQLYHADTCEPLRRGVECGEVELVARVRGTYPGEPLGPNDVPEVRTVGYWDAPQDQGWGLDWHRNEGIELTFVAQGKVAFAVDDQEFLLGRGDLTITRPWQLHRVGNPNVGACRLYFLILDVGVRRPNQEWTWPEWLVLSPSDEQSLTRNLSHNEQPVWHAGDEVAEYFDRLGAATASYDERKGDSRLKLYINGLFLSLSEMLQGEKPPLNPSLSSSCRTVELFLSTIGEHLDEDWSLDSMASACGLGKSRFSEHCTQLTNMSPNEYLSKRRIESATELLRTQPSLSITDVAFRVGFNSSQYFATVFRTHMGCTPRAFRVQFEQTPVR